MTQNLNITCCCFAKEKELYNYVHVNCVHVLSRRNANYTF